MGKIYDRYPHLRGVLNLPILERLMHKSLRRHLIAWGLGIVLMILGSLVSHFASVQSAAHPVFVTAAGELLHAVGAFPFVRHFEPLWLLLVGE